MNEGETRGTVRPVRVSMKEAVIMSLSKLPGLLGLVPDWFLMASFILFFFPFLLQVTVTWRGS